MLDSKTSEFFKNKYYLLFILAFSLAAATIYLLREDYYFKQNDQFYYLALADSLHESGQMLDLTQPGSHRPSTATSGAALVMYAVLAGLKLIGVNTGIDTVFTVVVYLYFLLHLFSLWPLFSLLRSFQFSIEDSGLAIFLYSISFPVLMFRLWPINEGPFLFIFSWLLFFLFAKKKIFPIILSSAVVAFFRPHGFFVLFCLALHSFRKGHWRREAFLLLASILAMAAGAYTYKLFFPYEQQALAQDFSSFLRAAILSLKSISCLFVSESIWLKIFKEKNEMAAAIFCVFVLIPLNALLILRAYKRISNGIEGKKAEFFQVSFYIFLIFLPVLFFSTVITARFLVLPFFFLIALLVASLSYIQPTYRRVIIASYVSLNCILLALFSLTGTTAEDASILRSIKVLEKFAEDKKTSLFYEKDLGINFRQVYAHYRRPSSELTAELPESEFYLLAHKDSKGFQHGGSLSQCRITKNIDGSVLLAKVRCK